MKDFVSGRDIDIQSLLEVVRCAEETPEKDFSMRVWRCGTKGCLIGSFCNIHKDDNLQIIGITPLFMPNPSHKPDMSISLRFNLSLDEVDFLFVEHVLSTCRSEHAILLTKDQAIRRLRKFIYYKCRKAELLEDYEAARRTGDIGVADRVLELVS